MKVGRFDNAKNGRLMPQITQISTDNVRNFTFYILHFTFYIRTTFVVINRKKMKIANAI